MLKIFTLLLLFASFLFANIGTISLLEGKATILRAGQTLNVNLGDNLENKDIISTQVNSKIKITFIDNTIITIGKESSLNIEEYIFDTTNKSQAKTELNVLKGAFHTITGEIGKVNPDKFKLKTKSASIGIRGTEFYGDDNRIVCTQGRIIVLSNGVSVDVPAGNYINIFSNQRPSEVLPLENNTLEDIEERLNTNNQGNNGNNLDSFNNNPSSPLALDEAQSNNQENIDNQNSWGNWNQNLQALQDEKNIASLDNNISKEIINNPTTPDPTTPDPTTPDPTTPDPTTPDPTTPDPNTILTETSYVQSLIDSRNTTELNFQGTMSVLNIEGNIVLKFSFGGNSNSVGGSFSWNDYNSTFIDGIPNANGFSADAGGIGPNGDFSSSISGKFYGTDISKVAGDIDINDQGNTTSGTFSATR